QTMYSTRDASYRKGHPSRGAAKALLAKVYNTIGSASMPAGSKISVMGGPAFFYNDDNVKVRISYPTRQVFDKELVAGYESFDSKEYYRLGMDKAMELINDGDFDLFPTQQELWSPANK